MHSETISGDVAASGQLLLHNTSMNDLSITTSNEGSCQEHDGTILTKTRSQQDRGLSSPSVENVDAPLINQKPITAALQDKMVRMGSSFSVGEPQVSFGNSGQLPPMGLGLRDLSAFGHTVKKTPSKMSKLQMFRQKLLLSQGKYTRAIAHRFQNICRHRKFIDFQPLVVNGQVFRSFVNMLINVELII